MENKRENRNVQKESRKRFIGQIVSCVCLNDHYGTYILNMKLHPLGEYECYEYDGKNSVRRFLGDKIFYLTDDAKAIIKKEIGYYKVSISKMIAWPSRKYLRDKNIRVCFKNASGGGYTYYVGFRNREGKKGSARGCYLNFLETENCIFLPVFAAPDDKRAIEAAKCIFNKEIIPVEINEIAADGGCLNCISWEE